MQKIKLFLASSSELENDRKEFEIFINRKNKEWVAQDVFLELVVWEDFLDAVSQTRLQDEYNQAIKECELFVMLFFTKVGQYTEEEFETAFGQFQETHKPLIFTYFKDAEITTGSANEDDLISLWAFKKKLKALGHFHSTYKNIEELILKFTSQLEKLASSGFIELKAGMVETAAPDGEARGSLEINRQVTGYLHWLQARMAGIELRGIERAGGAKVVVLPLETAYVPLRVKALPRLGENETNIPLNQVLGLHKRLVVLGAVQGLAKPPC